MLMKKVDTIEDEIRLFLPRYESLREKRIRLKKYDTPSNFRGVTIDIIRSEEQDLFWKYFNNTDTTTQEGWDNWKKFKEQFPLIRELQKSKWKFEDRLNFFNEMTS